MRLATVSVTTEDGTVISGTACATRSARKLSSWSWGVGCPPLNRGTGYNYQRHKVRTNQIWRGCVVAFFFNLNLSFSFPVFVHLADPPPALAVQAM